MDIIVYIHNYRKGAELRYVDAATGEVLYDMFFTLNAGAKLSDIIGGIEKLNSSRFDDDVRIRWVVSYDE